MSHPNPNEISSQLQHARDDRSKEMISAFSVCLAFAIISVVLRFVSRHLTKAALASDDWMIVVGLLFTVGYIVGQAIGIAEGLGRHAVFVGNPSVLTKAINASIIFYINSMAAIKISILFLYRRIFSGRKFHIILWAVGVFVLSFTIANDVFIIFRCHPVKAGWNPQIKGDCIDTDAGIVCMAILTIVTDFIILGLPLPSVWKLHLSRIRRVELTGIFLLGTFASVVSIYRATQIVGSGNGDPTWEAVNRAIWSGVEPCIAIICACLPTLRPVIRKILYGDPMSSAGSGHSRQWTRSITAKFRSHQNESFNRLEQPYGMEGEPTSRNRTNSQPYESYLMSSTSSSKKPDNAHFEETYGPNP